MSIGRIISRAWKLMFNYPGPLIGGIWLGQLLAGFCFILAGPVLAGNALVSLRAERDDQPDVGDVFRGFDFFTEAFVASLMVGLLCFAGTVLCIIPGIIAAVGLMYTFQFIADRGMNWSEAMRSSWELVKGRFWDHFVLLLALAGINFLGALACGVGVILTVPLTHIALSVAYNEMTSGRSFAQ